MIQFERSAISVQGHYFENITAASPAAPVTIFRLSLEPILLPQYVASESTERL